MTTLARRHATSCRRASLAVDPARDLDQDLSVLVIRHDECSTGDDKRWVGLDHAWSARMNATRSEMAESRATSFERLRSLCAEVGFDVERIRPSILARMRLLAETTETLRDCERCVGVAKDVFRHYDTSKPLERFNALERRIVVIGSLFSDIGKTGPATADRDGQQLVAEMFAVENVIDGGAMSVTWFLAAYFPADAPDRVRRFGRLGLDAGMTMREFWNLHSAWSLHILQGDGVPAEAVPAAATHHLLENVNPDSIVARDGRFTKYFGKHAEFARPEKLVILLDKYDASRRRGGLTHDEAIIWLRHVIIKNHRFCGDQGFLSLIEDLDAVMKVREARQRCSSLARPSPKS